MRSPQDLHHSLLLGIAFCMIGCGAASPLDEQAPVSVSPTEADISTSAETAIDPAVIAENDFQRKIIYTAHVDLQVSSFASIPAQVRQLAEDFDGYIASSNLQGVSGNRRSGRWVIKVPVKQYSRMLGEAASLGELQSQREDTTEVTAEFYDLEARLKTRQSEEQRMLQHLAEDTGSLEDTLSVEKELTRIREEVERIQGQLRLLTHQTDYSTVNLYIYEFEGYQPKERIGLLAESSRTFFESIRLLGEFFRSLVIVTAAILPWLVLVSIPIFLLRKRIWALLWKEW